MKRNLHFLLILLFAAMLTGCESQIKKLEAEKLVSRQRLEAVQTEVSYLQNQSQKLNGEIKANHNKTMAMVRQNPGIVSCIAAGGIALEEGNVFSEDLKKMSGLWGLGCAFVYVFDENFQKEVDSFVTEIEQSSEFSKKLQSQINALKPKIEEKKRQLRFEEAACNELQKKIDALR